MQRKIKITKNVWTNDERMKNNCYHLNWHFWCIGNFHYMHPWTIMMYYLEIQILLSFFSAILPLQRDEKKRNKKGIRTDHSIICAKMIKHQKSFAGHFDFLCVYFRRLVFHFFLLRLSAVLSSRVRQFFVWFFFGCPFQCLHK